MKNWLEFNNKYKNKLRDFMNKEEEREFVLDYCICCEKEGFNKIFWTPYEEQKEHIGKKFKVLRRLTEEECFLECMPMWRIEFEDGIISGAYPEEIVPSEMKRQNCPNEYLNVKENIIMIKTWDDLKEKYIGHLNSNGCIQREFMTKQEEQEFVQDLFFLYENEGFNKIFWSPSDNIGEEKYYGKPFKVIGRCPETRNNLAILPLWDIKFEDGKQLTVEPFEIITSQMRMEGCPEEFLINTQDEVVDKESLKAQLIDKVEQELTDFRRYLYVLTVDEVLNSAYKFTMFEEFVLVFRNFANNYLSKDRMKRFLQKDNLLESIYTEWKKYDSDEQEIYKDFIFDMYNEEF